MTFLERYSQATTWQEKCIIFEIFQFSMRNRYGKRWQLINTADYFGVSLALVSENLKLAEAIHTHKDFDKIVSRKQALKKLMELK